MTTLLMVCLGVSLASEPDPWACAGVEGDSLSVCQARQRLPGAKSELEALGDCSGKEGEDATACQEQKTELEEQVAKMTAWIDKADEVEKAAAEKAAELAALTEAEKAKAAEGEEAVEAEE